MNFNNLKFISKNNTPLAENPRLYFKKPEDFVGIAKHNNKFYLMKRVPLAENMNPEILPEVQILDNNFSSPYLANCLDYIIEQEIIQGMAINRCVYIVYEMIDDDLASFIKKKGPLNVIDFLKLLESLVSVNYDLQKELGIAHGDIKPSNILIKYKQDAITNEIGLEYKLSFFDNNNYLVLNNNSFLDSLAFKAPELLFNTLLSTNFMNKSINYRPSEEIKQLFEKYGDEIKYNPFRSDTFSVGLVLIYAATGSKFVLRQPTSKEEVYRDGHIEHDRLSMCIDAIKQAYKCDGVVEILRAIMLQNPFPRCDFEEFALRINKISERNKAIPYIEIEGHNVVPMEDYETLKDNYWEVQEQVEELQQRIKDLETQIKGLKEETKSTRRTGLNLSATRHILQDMSSIMIQRDQGESFLSDIGKDISIVREKDEASIEEDEQVQHEIKVSILVLG